MTVPNVFALLAADVKRASPNATLLHYSQQVTISSGPVPIHAVGSERPPGLPVPPRRSEGPLKIGQAAVVSEAGAKADPPAVLELLLPLLREALSEAALRRMGIDPPWPVCPHHHESDSLLRIEADNGRAWWICPESFRHRIAVGGLGL